MPRSKESDYVWHPCSQMKDYENFKPLVITEAQGSYLSLKNHQKIIDAVSSWWCKSLGHQHPRLKKALAHQLERFEHVILANTTNDVIVKLSQKLAGLTQSLTKSFYASDGSSAVEIALKMSLHARQIQGEMTKTKFIALKNGYHGETLGAMSVSDLGLYKNPYRALLFETSFISPAYVSSQSEALWQDCSEVWEKTEKLLASHVKNTTALILEPIVQGAGGMKIYSQDFLKRLRRWTQKHNIHLIADEIMTGLGRTGKMLACDHAGIEPDLLCLSKGLTAGFLPLSAVVVREDIYELFYDDYETGKAFLHSHTYAGNALAASVALETLAILTDNDFYKNADKLGNHMIQAWRDIESQTGKIKNIRQIGAIAAADLISTDKNRRLGYEIYQKAVEYGALLRPLGNTLYWLPPLNTDIQTLDALKEITQKAVMAVKF